MPGLTQTTFGSGNQRWLASSHGLREARSGYGVLSNFSEDTHYPDGYIPSGTAVNAAVENDLRPWTGAAGEALGFIVTDREVPVGDDEGFTAPVLRHGIIDTDHLPVDLPTEIPGDGEGAEPQPIAGDVSGFVFVGGQEGEDF